MVSIRKRRVTLLGFPSGKEYVTAPDRRTALAALSGSVLTACRARTEVAAPEIEFTRIPQADPTGREKNDIIEGRVKGHRAGQLLVLYARSGKWWLQPLVGQPFTRIKGAKWSNATHLGTEYAALLVEPGHHPPPVLDALPRRGNDVAAVVSVPGGKTPPSVTISFSGYEWRVRDAPSDRGGKNEYASSNAWTDANGAMHLRIAKRDADFTCAEVSLMRSLGYGTYRFVVRDISQLLPAAVFGMFTWDYAGGEQGNREMDIEISRWGDPVSKNAQYVVQPYYVAANVMRFTAPPGRLIHTFQWQHDRAAFRTMSGSRVVAEHAFTSGVPAPGIESVRMNLYVFRAPHTFRDGAEVVIENFEYLP
ncbi:MAG: hypothetical protein JWP63_3027 [Candidatus Solibacter sp.]|nr:hypothetical protein [Candidatus Solibacter sp.]